MQKVDSGLPVRTLESSGSTALILTGGVLSPTPAICEMASKVVCTVCAYPIDSSSDTRHPPQYFLIAQVPQKILLLWSFGSPNGSRKTRVARCRAAAM